MSGKPEAAEHNPYYSRYIDLVPEGDIVSTLRDQFKDTLALIRTIPEPRGGFRYSEGKWSVKEMLGHLIDAERIFVYRALCIARGEKQNLPGFEEDDYVRGAAFDSLQLSALIEEFESVRNSTVRFFASLRGSDWKKMGTANGSGVSVRAIAYIMAGHERHHLGVLRERYLISG